MSSTTTPDCLRCGACCADGRLVDITKRDKKRLPAAVKVEVATSKTPQLVRAVSRFGSMETQLAVMLGGADGMLLMPKRGRSDRCSQLRGRVGAA